MEIDALRRHDPAVLGCLLEQFGRQIQTLAYVILRDEREAEETLAETLLTALARGHQLRDADSLRPWLLKIATNQALGLRRKSSRLVALRLVPEPVAGPGDDLAVLRAALDAALADLPPRVRAAVALRYYADLSVEEVSAALGTSRNTVKTQLRVGLERLRAELRDDDEPPYPKAGSSHA